MRQPLFDFAVQCTGRVCVTRDRLLRRIGRRPVAAACAPGSKRLAIESGDNVLDAVLMEPLAQPARASVLICHGIAETVQHWQGVQQLLAAHGVASLVFDYAGYGNSSGSFRARQSELDAESAFRALEGLTAPLPVSLLGFSLGSGIAAAVVTRVPAKSLLLCAAFTSIRAAAGSIGVFGVLRHAAPSIWNSLEAVRVCPVPVQIVHGAKDRLFPAGMASALEAACAARGELILVPGTGHKDPYARPQLSFWGPVVTHLVESSAEKTGAGAALLRSSCTALPVQ